MPSPRSSQSLATRSLVGLASLAVSLSAVTGIAVAAEKIGLLPAEITLRGPQSSHQVLVQARLGDDFGRQLNDAATFHSSDEGIVEIRGGKLYPVANGRATITATVDGATATASVTVESMQVERKWTFRHDVQPVLAKMSCNSGACHGALAGKGGLKLSLRGYDTHRDWQTITRQARGRRIELADPGRSLLVAKPSGAMPHKGGLRFDVDSRAYRILTQWIAAGAPPPTSDDPRFERLEILPQNVVLKPGGEQQYLVRAHYSDGDIRDVTPFVKFAATNDAVATVSKAGRLTVSGFGEGAVTAWFSSKIAIARVTSPYAQEVPTEIFAEAPRRNFIDDLVLTQLQRLNLPPSPRSTDTEFLRRAHLDTIGTLPTTDAVRRFLADEGPDKRDRLIESLLSRSEFVDYWTYKWSDMLLLSGQNLRPEPIKTYYQWVRERVARNQPWDEFVREIVTAQGSTYENGATNFYSLHQDPESMSENVSQAFLGLSIACAKCHNHPLEKWTNDQYYAMANLFSRVRAKGWGGDARSGDGKRTVYVVEKGELIQPLTGVAQRPAPLDGEPLEFDATEDRRVHLAAWLTSPENPYFARSITNRVWANYYGVGLVEPVDDMRTSNPASNERLLQAAADYLVEHDFDLKALMRAILRSETYQRSSKPLSENRDEHRFYSRYYPRRLMAEVLLDAISQVTDVPTPFTEVAFKGADRQKTDFYPQGTRAIQLYDAAVGSYFLSTFGRNERQITCECERSDEPSMVQVLHLSNGDTINRKLRSEGSRVSQFLAADAPNDAMIENAYLLALSRRPTDQEMQRLLGVMNEAGSDSRRLVIEDLFWSILSSREFLFNH